MKEGCCRLMPIHIHTYFYDDEKVARNALGENETLCCAGLRVSEIH